MNPEKKEDLLASLRQELDGLDRVFMETAARRQEIVQRIAEIKTRQGRGIFDRTREQQVYVKASQTARDCGLKESLGLRLMRILVEASHDVQREALSEEARRTQEPKRILIVGGGGAMGRLFVEQFGRHGHHVDILEKDETRNREKKVVRADVVLISVDMDQALGVAREVAPHVRSDALLTDINSLKYEICQVYKEDCIGESLGLHPMFGPSAAAMHRQKVIFCPVKSGPLTGWMKGELGRMGLDIVEADPEQHDKAMAVIQVLVHFRTLVMGEALRRAGLPIAEGLRFTSPIYRLEMGVVSRLFAQDPDLYASIEMDNPHGIEVRRLFRAAAKDLDDIITRADRGAFRDLFKEVAGYFEGFSQDAMKLTDAVMEALIAIP